MAKKGSKEKTAEVQITAVEFINQYNREVQNFSVDLSMEVLDSNGVGEVVAGISIEMGDGGMPAFIPADILRILADEAEASAHQAIAVANARRGLT